MTTLIGTRWKHSNVLSRGVLIPRQNSRKELWESRKQTTLVFILFFFVSLFKSVSMIECSVLVLCRWGYTRSLSEHGS